MLTIEENSIILEALIIGEISAGTKNVVPFTPRRTPITIVLPHNMISHNDDVIVLRLVGNSLAGSRLCDGDFLICRTKFEMWEIKPDTICAVYINSRNEYQAKRVRLNNDGTVTLLPCNPAFEEKTYFADEIEIHGIAIGGQIHF
jgi:SOS-response transcriptional repressor LexA